MVTTGMSSLACASGLPLGWQTVAERAGFVVLPEGGCSLEDILYLFISQPTTVKMFNGPNIQDANERIGLELNNSS